MQGNDTTRTPRRSGAWATAVQSASPDAILVMDAAGLCLDLNPAAEAMFMTVRDAMVGRRFVESLADTPARNEIAGYFSALAGELPKPRAQCVAMRANGQAFVAELSLVVADKADDAIVIAFVRDLTETKRAEERQSLLISELDHRGKNLLAVVQGLARRTLRDYSAEEARLVLDRRLTALARSQAHLMSDPVGLSLRRLVEQELDGFATQADIEGPEIALKASAAQTMALVVHELMTNAVKYGALSTVSGHIEILWSGDRAADTFGFCWRERGGPPPTTPTRVGFGRAVLEKVAANDFETNPSMDFSPEGLVYAFTSRLSAVVGNL